MNWISVKDKLPEVPKNMVGVPVLVAQFDSIFEQFKPGHGHSIHEGFFNGKTQQFEELVLSNKGWVWVSVFDPVTHWRLLPDPPTQQANIDDQKAWPSSTVAEDVELAIKHNIKA